VADVGEVDWCSLGGAVVQTEAGASVPIGEASQLCTGAP
jgi:hypothetical protein